MPPTLEWYREQSEYNRRVYERLVADYDDLADWKVNALFYSALHRVNYRFAKETGRAPGSHIDRNSRVRHEMSHIFYDYKELYTASSRARYCDGFRVTDDRQKAAYVVLCRIEKKIPF